MIAIAIIIDVVDITIIVGIIIILFYNFVFTQLSIKSILYTRYKTQYYTFISIYSTYLT